MAELRDELAGLLAASSEFESRLDAMRSFRQQEFLRIANPRFGAITLGAPASARDASPGAIPRHLTDLRDKIRVFVLPERRSGRVAPRAVKIKMSNYARKLPVKSSSRNRVK